MKDESIAKVLFGMLILLFITHVLAQVPAGRKRIETRTESYAQWQAEQICCAKGR